MPTLRNGKRAAPDAAQSSQPKKRIATPKAKSSSPKKAEAVEETTPPPSTQVPRRDSLQASPVQKKKASPESRKKSSKQSNEQQKPSTSKSPPNEPPQNKENEEPTRPSTPPTTSTPAHRNEKTPGRVGPDLPEKMGLSPDIAPFKGPKGNKVRKTPAEKSAVYDQFILNNPEHCFHELYVCRKKGPRGSPTYDKAGFELDKKKVEEWFKPVAYNKDRMMKSMAEAVEKRQAEDERKREIFFEKGAAPHPHKISPLLMDLWDDRVSKDLMVPIHNVGVKEYEEWERKGFPRAKQGEFWSVPERQRERLPQLTSGSALRK
ncbi:hypothetical protein B9Z65_6379 [Elsinoe australis]|uniref:Uncharacterized protein n=1 Tax=Elsinoe australis TaxID=40998 RepID=A0A2P8A8G7_9PEZI|nr:hypothetical protein B9Z65_6379 [Elsinoe australis]